MGECIRMSILAIDLETYSELDIKKVGLYKYAENSEILLFAYAFDDEPVQVVDIIGGESLPFEVIEALQNEEVMKVAYNAAFERVVLNHHYPTTGIGEPSQWFCTMVQGFTLGLPGGLDKVGKALGIEEDKQKLATGKKLIQYFSKPCRPTKVNGGRTRNRPQHDREKWAMFKEYCRQDVEAERAIRRRLEKFYPIPSERQLWALDQRINDNGVLLDNAVIDGALQIDMEMKYQLTEVIKLTGVENPNSLPQITGWIRQKQPELKFDTFDKTARAELLKRDDLLPEVRKVIELKNLLSKTSCKKYQAMRDMRCLDGRVHGMLQFYGASRTGRWAGRGVQLHNLPQNHLDDLDEARNTVKTANYEVLEQLYDSPADVLSQLIRTAFIAPANHRFIVADFSAIEARVIAWLADEKWRMQVFANGGDIYCASASQMFHVPVEKHGINGHLRQKGKVAELACGYGGGVNALKAFGADKMGMTQQEMEKTIKQWREASPNICKLWRSVEDSVKKAIRTKLVIVGDKGIKYKYYAPWLFIKLPSGRKLAYYKPRIEQEEGFGERITYEGAILAGGWGRNYTWGGKLVENLVQGIARDCLAVSMLRLAKAGYKIVMHVHDEVILEEPYSTGSLENACAIMGQPIDWAPGLLLRADGYETEYYRKD